jgi:hypothetical protein
MVMRKSLGCGELLFADAQGFRLRQLISRGGAIAWYFARAMHPECIDQ